MSDLAIRVENLGKRYVIGGKQERYSTLRDTIVDMAASPFRRIGGVLRGKSIATLNSDSTYRISVRGCGLGEISWRTFHAQP